MREILFRGKQITDKVWVFGGVETISDGKPYICKRARYRPDTRDWDTSKYYEKDPHYTRACVVIIPNTLGQFVGFNDKNDAKIFEGDIIRFDAGYALGRWTGVIEYDDANAAFVVKGVGVKFRSDESGAFKMELSSIDKPTIEIIGNRWDNPELLKGE